MPFDNWTIVVAGGGMVGAALATLFARDGKQVVVIDKDMGEQETTTGEGLQTGAYKALQRMQLEGRYLFVADNYSW